MKYRKRIGKSASKRIFRKTSRVKSINTRLTPMRGGIRM